MKTLPCYCTQKFVINNSCI